ncbi:hypothetical protein BOO69_05155 [Sulfitobacter alexandrii]|uniref:DUF4174 domain-containing protein n=1 Tax=Sulfitobacter alexandrii TaxID=1917485 RepID=A0A1J0WFG7_9RHOB|nr:DUF4174 domain-containing protein [Sulfitobacter alexandrii]APE42878.1 hypothetical protein BOO69_05155 [Sulfitobacter alexandrii]
MKYLLTLVFAGVFATQATAQSNAFGEGGLLFAPAEMEDLSEFRWKKRPVVVFADSPDDPAYIEQMELLRAQPEDLATRDVIVLSDTDPDARAPLRLRMRPRGFMLVLVGKDGEIKLRKPFPWDVREITRSIDKMPMRQREIRERKEAEGVVIQ